MGSELIFWLLNFWHIPTEFCTREQVPLIGICPRVRPDDGHAGRTRSGSMAAPKNPKRTADRVRGHTRSDLGGIDYPRAFSEDLEGLDGGRKAAHPGGPPGTGKTTVAAKMAATLSMGGIWPDGSVSPFGNVMIWSGEDDPADTLLPRLTAAGADTHRIYFVGNI